MRRRRRRRSKIAAADGPPAGHPLPAARVPAHLCLGPQPVDRMPVHQRLNWRRNTSKPRGRFRTNDRRSSAPTHAPPPRRAPRAAAPVDADGFTLVQSHRREHPQASSHPRRQRPVPSSLIGRCFNCLADDHVAARCTFLSCCLFCLSTRHRARNCKHGRRPPRHLPSDQVGGSPGRGRPRSLPHQPPCNGSDHQGADRAPEPQVSFLIGQIPCPTHSQLAVGGGGPCDYDSGGQGTARALDTPRGGRH
jgi:hypothetical protein